MITCLCYSTGVALSQLGITPFGAPWFGSRLCIHLPLFTSSIIPYNLANGYNYFLPITSALGVYHTPFCCILCDVESIMSLIRWSFIYRLSLQVTLYILFGGLLCIYTQYNIDHQRQEFRDTHGKAKVWGIFATKVWIINRHLELVSKLKSISNHECTEVTTLLFNGILCLEYA